MSISQELQNAITRYLEACVEDYKNAGSRNNSFLPHYEIEPGRKFIRVWMSFGGAPHRSAHCFINVSHPKFKMGDLLRPASYKAPMLNAARGNVLDPQSYRARWVGVGGLR